MKASRSRLIVATLLMVLLPIAAFAAGHGSGAEHGGGEHEAHAGSIMDIWLFWANFLVYVMAMYFLLRKPIVSGWESRRQGIAARVESSQAELKKAEALLVDAQEKQKSIPREIVIITQDIKTQGEREAQQIVEEAKKRASRIVAQAREGIAIEQKALQLAIKRELAELVTARARERLSQEITSGNDKVLRTSALQGVRGLVQ